VVILDAFITTRLILPHNLFPSTGRAAGHSNLIMLRKRRSAGGGSKPSPFLNLTPSEWPLIFDSRREDVLYAIENKPFIESREPEDSVVRCFMKNYDESDACLPRADKVEQYCFGATMEALKSEKGVVGEPIAWLDERSSAGGNEQVRRYRGPLTPRRLYQELKRPVS
jgi:hypothetical protein